MIQVIAEIGINHNGSLEQALEMMDKAKACGCDLVKFQKRTVELVYTAEELARPRDSIFGTTNGALKYGLEFGLEQYREIDAHSKKIGLPWFASAWDELSLDFLSMFDCQMIKIPSALLTNERMLLTCKRLGIPVMLSTGMSTLHEIEKAIWTLEDGNQPKKLILMHTTSAYPSELHELNLRMITTLRHKFPYPVGYSGHEVGLATTLAAAALGATYIERHFTLRRHDWGSDQSASVEPGGMRWLCENIHELETAMGTGVKEVYASERPIMEKLRR